MSVCSASFESLVFQVQMNEGGPDAGSPFILSALFYAYQSIFW